MTNDSTRTTRHGSAVITLPSDTEYLITRVFDAPAELVFRAMTTPELVKRWWGFETSEWLVCEIDLRVGGAYRFVWRNPDGSEFAMNGIYREIVRPERIVNTQRFDTPWLPGESVLTTTLAESGGKTTFTCTTLYDSIETRDKMLKSGMESGASASYERLEALLTAK